MARRSWWIWGILVVIIIIFVIVVVGCGGQGSVWAVADAALLRRGNVAWPVKGTCLGTCPGDDVPPLSCVVASLCFPPSFKPQSFALPSPILRLGAPHTPSAPPRQVDEVHALADKPALELLLTKLAFLQAHTSSPPWQQPPRESGHCQVGGAGRQGSFALLVL